MRACWLLLLAVVNTFALEASSILREIFAKRSPVSASYSNQLPRNWCASDILATQPTPWSFRRRRNFMLVDDVSDTGDAKEGDWLRFTGKFTTSCTACQPEQLSSTALLNPACSEKYLYIGFWEAPPTLSNMYTASFVYEYPKRLNMDCSLSYPSGVNFVADPQAKFIMFSDSFKNGVLDLYNNGLRPLFSSMLTNNGQPGMAGQVFPIISNLVGFCGLFFIQCLSVDRSTSYSDERVMLAVAHPEVYARDSRPSVSNFSSLFDYSRLTGFAVLLGGDSDFALANDININLPVMKSEWRDAINAMFMLDMSFNPGLQLGLTVSLGVRVLLLGGSPGVEVQWNTNFNQRQFPVLSLSGDDKGIPLGLEVLSLSIDRKSFKGFLLRNIPNLSIVQVDDSDYFYGYPFQTISTFSSVPSDSSVDLAEKIADSWPVSVIPRYDSSCRDMYFDRYFFYGNDLFAPGKGNLPDNYDRVTALSTAPVLASNTKILPFIFACQENANMSIKHFAILGLPISSLQGPCLRPDSLQTLQIEGTQIMNTSSFFGVSSTTASSFSPNSTVRLAHNVLLSDVSSLSQMNARNLLFYGNSRLDLSTGPAKGVAFASAVYVDASFSENIDKQIWKATNLWSNAQKITCRDCNISKWPQNNSLSKITHLRLPMNAELQFNMSEFNNSNDKNGIENFFLDFSSRLTVLDLSSCNIQGSFIQSQYVFPNKISFAHNSLESYTPRDYEQNSTLYEKISIFKEDVNAMQLFGGKVVDLRSNFLMGNEPSFYDDKFGSLVDISDNQISCNNLDDPIGTCDGSTFFQPRTTTRTNYCSYAAIKKPFPRFMSSLATTKFEIELENAVVGKYSCLRNVNSVETGKFMCPMGTCAHLRVANNPFPPMSIPIDASQNPKVIQFLIPRFPNMSTVCSTRKQMPLIKNSILVGCELELELWLGDETTMTKILSFPPFLYYAKCRGGQYLNVENNCSPCKYGEYLPTPDASTLTSNQKQCFECPSKATTSQEGSVSFSQCICGNGTYGDLSANKCSLPYWDHNKCFCKECPAHATCVNQAKFPFPDDGFKSDESDATIILQCLPAVACVNNRCQIGYEGNACSKCQPKYYRLQQACVKCPSADGFIIFLGVLVFVFGSFFLLKASRPSITKIYTISITVGFVQIISIFASFPVQWPTEATMMFDIFSFVNFNIDLFSPECALELDFYAKWGLKMAMPLMLFVFFVVIFGVVRFVPCVRKYYIKFLLWKIGADVKRVVPSKYRQNLAKSLQRASSNMGSHETNTFSKEEFDEGKEQVVVKSLNSLPLGSSKRFSEAEIQVSLGLEKVVPLSAVAQYEVDREWEETHLSSRFIHAFVATCCLGYTFLAKTSTQIFNCVNLSRMGDAYFLRYDPSVACYSDRWYEMEIAAVFAVLFYTIGIPLFFAIILFRGWRKGNIETPEFYQHYGQLVLPYRAQYWYWELVQIGRKLIVVMVIDFGANLQGDNTYSQISGVLIVLLLFLVLQEFIKPYEYTWCNRLAFTWTAISLLVLVAALFFVVGSLTETQKSDYGVGLLISCFLGLVISIYTALREGQRASAKTRVAPTKDFLSSAQEEQAVVNTIFGRSLGEPLYRKTRGLHPIARAGFYQHLVRLHTSMRLPDETASSAQSFLAPEEEMAQVRARLSELESRVADHSFSADPKKDISVELASSQPSMCAPSSSSVSPTNQTGPLPLSPTLPIPVPLVKSSTPPPPYCALGTVP